MRAADKPLGDYFRTLHAVSLPFSEAQFLDVMERYNEAVFPLQIALVLLGLTAYGAMVVHRRDSDRLISVILAALWIWSGVVYQYMSFREINNAATVFAIVFVLGALLFLWAGLRGRLAFEGGSAKKRIVGHVLVAYALVLYPILSAVLGREFPGIPTFGLPCPTTVFTIGMLAFVSTPVPRYVFAVPIAWAFVGGQAAFLLGVYEDLGLLGAGIVALWLAFERAIAPE